MKEPTLSQRFEDLKDPTSSYYCGASVFFSLLPLFRSLKETSIGFEEAFPGTEELLKRLIAEDGRLFQISMKKEAPTEEEWTLLTEGVSDYSDLISTLYELISFCEETEKKRFVPTLTADLEFLKSLAQGMMESLYEIDEPPEAFLRAGNSLMVSIRGDNGI
jgi:hypothetical protein